MPIDYEKWLMVPANIQDYVQNMMQEKSWQKRDNYRARLESIIEFCQIALKVEEKSRERR